ncbi:MAG: hypothetical protein IPJ20_13520, partial [Flammeovirgaceae bacterium]|nr:hypothetical protein [Flammeovirgaceae bacterium]
MERGGTQGGRFLTNAKPQPTKEHGIFYQSALWAKKFGEITGRKENGFAEVESGNNDTVRVRIGDRLYTPQEISA